MAATGRPFTKNDPRAAAGRKLAGRKPKSVEWRDAEKALREAIPRLLLMQKNDLQNLLASNPTGVEMLAAKYVMEHIPDTVNRFLGRTPNVLTGKDGEPLIPAPPAPMLPPIDFSKMTEEQLDRFIEATAQANRKAAEPSPLLPASPPKPN